MNRSPSHLAVLATVLVACSSPIEPSLTGAGPFLASNPITNWIAGNASGGASSLGSVAYISLPPGTLPGGTVIRILVERTGVVVPAALLDGGLDPVAVPAVAGDTISVTAEQSGGMTLAFRFTIPFRKPPTIVRTQPQKNKRDVPLNARLQIVFSEPIDPASLTPQNFVLRSGGTTVAGGLAFANVNYTTVEFTPGAELAPATEYELMLNVGIRDTDGTPLEASERVSFTTIVAQNPALAFGAVAGVIRGAGTGYPVNGNGMPGEGTAGWPVILVPRLPGGRPLPRTTPQPVVEYDASTGDFRITGLVAGELQIGFVGMIGWTGVFPSMRLYADTAINVTVLPNETVMVPEVVLRPVDPFIVVAVEHCPWGFSQPPTAQDWGNCDSGYWGGVDVALEVQGVAGTATAGIRYSLSIPRDRWHIELRNVPTGEYDVSVTPLESRWLLLPWQSSLIRLRVTEGLSYAEFDYWYQK